MPRGSCGQCIATQSQIEIVSAFRKSLVTVLVVPFAQVDQALALERDQRGRSRPFEVVRVVPPHSLGPRLVGLDGGAAGAELLRLAARVFELGAGVGVDELTRLDPLEAVTL
jgi:hypothetical protein